MISGFEDLVRDIAKWVPLCPPNEQVEELRRAWRGFCERTNLWQPDLVVDQTEGVTTIKLEYDFAATVGQVYEVRTRTQNDIDAPDPVRQRGRILERRIWRVGRTPDNDGSTVEILQPVSTTQAGGWLVKASLIPEIHAADCQNKELLNRYGLALAGKAIVELAGLPGRPWSADARALADKHSWYWQRKKEWFNGLNAGLREEATGNSNGEGGCVLV